MFWLEFLVEFLLAKTYSGYSVFWRGILFACYTGTETVYVDEVGCSDVYLC